MLRKLFKESLIYGLSRYIGKFIGVFLLPLYTAALTPEDYGILDLLGTITIVSSYIIISGTDSALGYYYYRREHIHERPIIISSSLWTRLIFAFIIFILIFFISPLISKILFGRDLSLFVIITGLTIIFMTIHAFLFNLFRFEFRAWLFTIMSTGQILVNILLTIYFVLILRKGVYGALTASAIAYGTIFIIALAYVFKRYGFHFSPIWVKRILSYGFPLIAASLGVWVLTSTDRYFLAHYTNLSSVGIYSVGMKLAVLLGLVSGAFQTAWTPFATDIQYHERAKEIYAKVFLIYFVVSIIGVFFISIFADEILKVFTQPQYYSAKAVVPFLCFSTMLSGGYFIVVIGIQLVKKLQHTIWITIGVAAANIGLNFLLTPKLGVTGAAFSLMTANLLIFLFTLLTSQRYYFVNYSYSKVLFIFLPAATTIAVSYYYGFKLFPRVILAAVYLSFAVIFLYINFKDTYQYRRIIERINRIKPFKWREPEGTNIEV